MSKMSILVDEGDYALINLKTWEIALAKPTPAKAITPTVAAVTPKGKLNALEQMAVKNKLAVVGK